MHLQTLALMFRGICTKNFNNFTFDIIDLLTGIDRAEDVFRVRPSNWRTYRAPNSGSLATEVSSPSWMPRSW